MFASAKKRAFVCYVCSCLKSNKRSENGWNAIQVILNMYAGYQKVPEFNHKVFTTRFQNTEESFIEK